MTDTERRRFDLLIPEVAAKFIQLRDACAARGVQLFLGSTLRTKDEQKNAANAGKSTQNLSWHMVARAVDAYPKVAGKDGKMVPDLAAKDIVQFRIMHEEAKKLGFRGLAFNPDGTKRFIQTKSGPLFDAAHLEFRGPHKTLIAAIAAEGEAFGLGQRNV